MLPPFSRRTRWNVAPNRLAAQLEAARRAGRPLVDLTESNPTRCGFPSTAGLIAELGHPRATAYEPDPLGHPEARAAIAGHHRERGAEVDPGRIVISASTSESYAWLFKLLCDDGDAVLVPQPSYPLFELLSTLEGVRLVPYPLMRDEGWRIDLPALEAAIDARTRAIMLVHPNNPTGSFTRRDEAERLKRIAAERGLALIVDEVFADYAHGPLPADRLPTFAGRAGGEGAGALTFVMSGLSKVAALPQLKLGWTLVSGPPSLARAAMERLEVIADTYLSVGTPVQRALPTILAHVAPLQAAIRARTAGNLAALDAAIAAAGAGVAVRRLPVDAGWSAILEVPRTLDEDAWVERLLADEQVLVHPGWFFDLEREGYLVLSLLSEPAPFADAIARVVAALER